MDAQAGRTARKPPLAGIPQDAAA